MHLADGGARASSRAARACSRSAKAAARAGAGGGSGGSRRRGGGAQAHGGSKKPRWPWWTKSLLDTRAVTCHDLSARARGASKLRPWAARIVQLEGPTLPACAAMAAVMSSAVAMVARDLAAPRARGARRFVGQLGRVRARAVRAQRRAALPARARRRAPAPPRLRRARAALRGLPRSLRGSPARSSSRSSRRRRASPPLVVGARRGVVRARGPRARARSSRTRSRRSRACSCASSRRLRRAGTSRTTMRDGRAAAPTARAARRRRLRARARDGRGDERDGGRLGRDRAVDRLGRRLAVRGARRTRPCSPAAMPCSSPASSAMCSSGRGGGRALIFGVALRLMHARHAYMVAEVTAGAASCVFASAPKEEGEGAAGLGDPSGPRCPRAFAAAPRTARRRT